MYILLIILEFNIINSLDHKYSNQQLSLNALFFRKNIACNLHMKEKNLKLRIQCELTKNLKMSKLRHLSLPRSFFR